MSFLRFVCKFLLVEKTGQKVGCLLFVIGFGKLNRTKLCSVSAHLAIGLSCMLRTVAKIVE